MQQPFTLNIYCALKPPSITYCAPVILRKQLEAIQEELGDSQGSKGKRKKDYKELIETSDMPEDVDVIKETIGIEFPKADFLQIARQDITEINIAH